MATGTDEVGNGEEEGNGNDELALAPLTDPLADTNADDPNAEGGGIGPASAGVACAS